MPKYTLKSTKYLKNEFAGQTCVFPLLGELTFDPNSLLFVETDEETVSKFLLITEPSFSFDVLNSDVDNGQDDEKAPNESGDQEPPKKPGRPKKEPTEAEKQFNEMKEMISIADTEMLLSLVRETKDESFMQKAAAMTDEKIKKELLKRLEKQIKVSIY